MNLRISIRAGLLTGAAAITLAGAARAEDCAQLAGAKLGHATVTGATIVAPGTVIAPLIDQGLPPPDAPYCRVEAVSRPSADSDIRIEIWLPLGSAWNGKFEQLGNGGFAGAIPYGHMVRLLARGYAVAGTDDGHRAKVSTDARWALHHRAKIVDYGWRAIDETAVTAKLVIARLKSKPADKSYFFGCSDGGREALMLAQRFPSYFDGIIAGAPAAAMTRLLVGGALESRQLSRPDGYLSAGKLALLQAHALQSCGHGAAYLTDPRQCHIDLTPLKCAAAETETCLTATQIETAQQIYEGRQDPVTGNTIYGVMPGAEALFGSWQAWLTGSGPDEHAAGPAFSWNYFAYMVMSNPKLDIGTVSLADMKRATREFAPIIDAENPDLSAFKARGGRLIEFQGWNDPGIPPGYALEYRDRLAAKMGPIADFYRLYMVPGMLHCGGGAAPDQVDWQAALETWVELGKPPGPLVASDGKGATQTLQPETSP